MSLMDEIKNVIAKYDYTKVELADRILSLPAMQELQKDAEKWRKVEGE